MLNAVRVIGAGLAGSEAAFFLAERGFAVTLHEMRPHKLTEAHKSGGFAELVCSNSLKSKAPLSAPGILKSDMTTVGSLILRAGEAAEVPAGEAMGVDREKFSAIITNALRAHPNITVSETEITEIAPRDLTPTLIATGPLTSEALSHWIRANLRGGHADSPKPEEFYFYDAIAPIVDASTIDMERAFLANRYDKGEEEAYLNCPMTEDEYTRFMQALLAGEKVPPKNFEKEKLFQGCQPIEAIAATGFDSLRFGAMKPVGLDDPRTGRRPHAVVQLRPENVSRTAYNLVGFQTKLKYGEQSRIFRMIPALEKAEFLRLGSIHRNTYVCGPDVLRADLSLKGRPTVYLAGQITGVEGYLESAACGMLAAIFMAQRLAGQTHASPPLNTGLGALLRHVTASDPKTYQPSNIHFGLFDPSFFDPPAGARKGDLRNHIAERSKLNFREWWDAQPLSGIRAPATATDFLQRVRQGLGANA